DWSQLSPPTPRNRNPEARAEAIRENRQLAILLASQGLEDDSSRFVLQSRRLQRVLRGRSSLITFVLRWAASALVDLVSGYGYRVARAILVYVTVVSVFALLYAHAPRAL